MECKTSGNICKKITRGDIASLEGQINACKEWCERNGITDYHIFAEEGSSSSEDWEREKLQEMITGIQNYEYEMIIVVDQFRITRDEAHFVLFKNILQDVDIYFTTVESGRTVDFNNEDDELSSRI